MEIDVIIPLYKPGKELFTLLDKLGSQSVPVHQVILLNTEEKYFDQLIYGIRFLETYQNIKVYHVSKREFDHGGTRRMGVKKSSADVFVMMTQDAMPKDDRLIEKLVEPLQGEVAVAYARQLPREDSTPVESYTREFIYAAKAVEAGYSVAYAADAQVVHSHNYTNGQQFHRNFDLGVSQAEHPEIFAAYPSESEGKRMVKDVTVYLRSNHMSAGLPHFYMQCACKYAGYLLGKNYRRLPKKWVLAFTSNKEYWKQNRKDV